MSLRRGDLVTVAAKGPYTAKPRPALVVQASETLAYRDSVTIVSPKPFGRLSASDLERVDEALRFWLGL